MQKVLSCKIQFSICSKSILFIGYIISISVVTQNRTGETKLHLACKRNSIGKIKDLIENGADINAKDNCDWTLLHEACNRGNTDATKAMLERSQKLDKNLNLVASADGGVTPMHDAISNNHYEAAVALLNYGGLSVLFDQFRDRRKII